MKVLIKKAKNIANQFEDLQTGNQRLWFESLPESSKKDYYEARDKMKTFVQNLPIKN